MAERPIAELEDEITQGAARIDAALCAWLLTLAEFDRRVGFERWECRSTAHFLNWRCGISLRAGREHVRVARRLEELPLVRAAFADGTLSYSKTRAISRCATSETEAQLVEWALHATAAQMDRVVAGRRSVDKKPEEARYVTWGHDDDGSFVLRARLSAEEGELVVAALASARNALSGQGDVTTENGPAGRIRKPRAVPRGRSLTRNHCVRPASTRCWRGPKPLWRMARHRLRGVIATWSSCT